MSESPAQEKVEIPVTSLQAPIDETKVQNIKDRIQAVHENGYLVTISSYQTIDQNQIEHMTYTNNFKREDIINTLEFLKGDMKSEAEGK